MKAQLETITWIPTEWADRPDCGTEVLLCTEDQLIIGYRDDEMGEDGSWMGLDGGVVRDVMFWAYVTGPEV